MGDLFRDILSDKESLFLQPELLDPEVIPPAIEGRQKEQRVIAECIKPLFSKRSGKHLLLTGKPGIGKTLVTKVVLQELEKETEEVYTLYVNAWKKDTAYKVVLDFCDQLGYKFVENRRTDELMREISRILNKKAAVIVIDEVDQLQDPTILYTLLEDILVKTLITITNNAEWIITLDQRIRSRFNPLHLEFQPYSLQETDAILRKRIDYAFAKNAVPRDVLNGIAAKAHALGDIRTGLFLLKEAGEAAEAAARRSIAIEDAQKAIANLKNFKINATAALGNDEQVLLDIIKASSGASTKEVFTKYLKQGYKQSYRTFLRRLETLEKSRSITLVHQKPGAGSTPIVHYGSIRKLGEFDVKT